VKNSKQALRIIWLPLAVEHLEDIYHFLHRLNPAAAIKLYNDILDKAEKLSASPLMASVEPLLDRESEMFRSLVVGRRYKVIYFIEDEIIKITDIWDCRRNPSQNQRDVLKRK
jgi:plasmid stabilization system protein ParE